MYGTFSPIVAQRCIHYFGGYITGMCRYGIHWDRRLHTTNREEYLLARFSELVMLYLHRPIHILHPTLINQKFPHVQITLLDQIKLHKNLFYCIL